MEWGYLIRLPKNTYKYILLYPAHMFLTVGMTLGIRVPVVGPLKDINFQKHSGAPLAVLVYIYIYIHWLVVSIPLKNISQMGLLFPIWKWKHKKCSKPPTSIYIYMQYCLVYIIYARINMSISGYDLQNQPEQTKNKHTHTPVFPLNTPDGPAVLRAAPVKVSMIFPRTTLSL